MMLLVDDSSYPQDCEQACSSGGAGMVPRVQS